MGESVSSGNGPYVKERVRVLHILAKSAPEINGYSIRGHEIIKAQLKSGLVAPVALTSPFYPDIPTMEEDTTIEGVEYYRSMPIEEEKMSFLGKKFLSISTRRNKLGRLQNLTNENKKSMKISPLHLIRRLLGAPFRIAQSLIEEKIRMKYFSRVVDEMILDQSPDIVHAHTPYKVGLPTLLAAKKHGKPFVYEVRGLWEESAVARGSYWRWGLRYWRFKSKETRVMKSADALFCISQAVKSDLVKRGVDEGKISVIRNGAPEEYLSGSLTGTELEEMSENDSNLSIELKKIKKSRKIIGYMGSIEKYEGLETLAESVKKLDDRGESVHLLIISTGKNIESISTYCRQIGMEQISTICGPVSRQNIPHFYNQIDIAVIPRLSDSRMAALVTPLKPLEPLSLGIPLIISDTKAIREIVSDNRATLFQGGDTSDLVEKILGILSNDERSKNLVKNGKNWVRENATWEISSRKTVEKYLELI